MKNLNHQGFQTNMNIFIFRGGPEMAGETPGDIDVSPLNKALAQYEDAIQYNEQDDEIGWERDDDLESEMDQVSLNKAHELRKTVVKNAEGLTQSEIDEVTGHVQEAINSSKANDDRKEVHEHMDNAISSAGNVTAVMRKRNANVNGYAAPGTQQWLRNRGDV